MAIKEWNEPIYLLQKGENKRWHHYFQRKKDENLTLRQLERQLKEEYHNTINKKWTNTEQLCDELKKYFADYDVRKFMKCYDFEKQKPIKYNPDFTPISFSQLGEWSTQDNWEDRIYQEARDIQESNAQLKMKIKADQEMEIFKLQEKARLLNLQDLVDGLEMGTLNGTQRQAISKSNKDLQDATNRDMGEVKDINQTNMTAEIKSDNKHEIDQNLKEEIMDRLIDDTNSRPRD